MFYDKPFWTRASKVMRVTEAAEVEIDVTLLVLRPVRYPVANAFLPMPEWKKSTPTVHRQKKY
jgi:hypothetical protein